MIAAMIHADELNVGMEVLDCEAHWIYVDHCELLYCQTEQGDAIHVLWGMKDSPLVTATPDMILVVRYEEEREDNDNADSIK